MDREPTIQQVLDLLEQLYQAVRRIARGEWLSVDLTMPQAKMMLVLFNDGPTRMGVLASDLGVSLPTATGIIDRLIEKDLVTREADPQDRRAVVCRLSEEGLRLISRLWELGESQARQLLEAMTSEELQLVAGAARAFLHTIAVVRPKLAAQEPTIEEA